MANTPSTGAEIVKDIVHSINQENLKEELITEQLKLEIEKIRLQISQVKQQKMITEYNTNEIFNALINTNVYSDIEKIARRCLKEGLSNNLIRSLPSQYLPIRNQTEAQTPDAETTAEEVPLNARHQHIVLFDFDNPTPNQTVEDTSKTTMEFSTSTEEKLEQVKAPDQTATDSNIENPTPTPNSEAVEAPAENKAQPTTGGSSQSQGK